MKLFKKMLSVLMAMGCLISVLPETGFCVNVCSSKDDYSKWCMVSRIFHPMRSGKNRMHSMTRDSSLVCGQGQNALCGTLNGTFQYVYGQVGICYYNKELKKNVFVSIYVRDAVLSNGQYAIPKWDGKGFYIYVNPNSPPLWIQPMFSDFIDTVKGSREFMSGPISYQKAGVDYSAYPNGAALSYLYLSLDANNQVTDSWLAVYDEDDKPVPGYVTLSNGDKIQMLYIEDDSDNSPEWDKVSFENPMEVTQTPTFAYAGYIPGRDYTCSGCSVVDLPNTELYYRVQDSDILHTGQSHEKLMDKLNNKV